MTKFSKPGLAPVFALAAVVSLTGAAHAGETSDDIVVTSRVAMEEWQADTTRTLNRALQRAPSERYSIPEPGIVQITFELGDNGRPTNLEVYSNSSDWSARRSARYAVRSLGDLSDVPVTNPGSAQFIANIIFADDDQQRDELEQKLEQYERSRLASDTAESDYITLGG